MLFVLDQLTVWTKIGHGRKPNGRKQEWTKSFGPKPVGRKEVERKLGARFILPGVPNVTCYFEFPTTS